MYDVYDRRIAKDVDDDGDGTVDRGERYVYDGTDIALVYDRSDNLVERMMHGPAVDQPLASEDGSGDVLWFLADNQGTIRDVAEYDDATDTTSVVNHIQYGGFGNITAQSNSTYEPRHTYTGREWDADSELFYYRARWYDPVVGRFISEDPIGFSAGDANLSRYVGNQAPNAIDPSGNELILQVFVDQPGTGRDRDVREGFDFGHAFILLDDTNDRNKPLIKGFYPKPPADNAAILKGDKVDGILKDDTARYNKKQYDISISDTLTDEEYQKLKQLIKDTHRKTPKYDLYNENCADWAIDFAKEGGLDLPKTRQKPLGAKGELTNPGDLGEDIRNLLNANDEGKDK